MTHLVHVARNEAIRAAILRGIRLVGRAAQHDMRRRIASYRADQAALRRRLAIAPDCPVRTYGPELRRSVEAYAATQPDARFAYTSGSTDQPKKIAFTRARIDAIKRGNLSILSRIFLRYDVRRAVLFILSGLRDDDSLSSLILSDQGEQPPFLSGLLMPARYLAQPAMAAAVERYGATAARLFLFVLSDPGLVYSTNPSTLALFLTDVYDDWPRATAMLRDLVERPRTLDPELLRIAAKVASTGWRERATRATGRPAPMAELAPGLQVYCCWDGGYVRPFLDQVRAFLPPERFALVPMYSMSTETIETVNHFDGDEVRFLTLAPGVLYEFLPAVAPDEPSLLLEPWQLVAGELYTLVASDGHGLCRYQTEDIFLCTGHVGDVPDLRFIRRRGLTYSFTGEKITDGQLEQAFARLREAHPALARGGVQLTLIPSRSTGDVVPRYRLGVAYPASVLPPDVDVDALGPAFDDILASINGELADKHASGRLGPTVATAIRYDELAARLDPKTRDAADETARVWDTQFKLLPLYRRLWKEYGLSGD